MNSSLRDAKAPVVFHINGIGDRLMGVPALRALSAIYPGRLTVVGPPGDGLLFYSGLRLRAFRELSSEMKGSHRVVDTMALRRAMGDCDLFISFNTWHTSELDAFLSGVGACETLGFFQGFNRHVPKDESRHIFDQFFELAQQVESSLRFDDFTQAPDLPPASVEVGRKFRANIPAGTKVLAVHTETASSKQWRVERLRNVLDSFLARHPEWMVLVLDQVDPGLESIPQGEQVLTVPGIPLPTAMALLGHCDAFLGVDSCMLHAADLFRLPSIGLFGPTSERRWGFRVTAYHRHLSRDGSMDAISEADVSDALEELALRA